MSENKKKDTPEQEAFEQYCREWLADNVPEAPPFKPLKSGAEVATEEHLAYYGAAKISL